LQNTQLSIIRNDRGFEPIHVRRPSTKSP
jgi:hypothetical protein